MAIVVEVPQSPLRIVVTNQKNLKIVFFGTPQFAVPSLRALVADHWPLSLVITAPDKPVGRKALLTPSPVKQVAQELGTSVATPATLKDDIFWQEFEAMKPDLGIVVAYGKLIPKRYLDVPRLGFINVHPSLLPTYRGPSPIQSALLNGDTQTGVSIMLLDEAMDHGPVLTRESWHIPSGFNASACEDELARVGAHLLTLTLEKYVHGEVVPQPQDHSAATITKKFTREDGKLDLSQSSVTLANRIRALSAEPGTWITYHEKVLNILEAHLENGALVFDRVQLEGGRAMSARDFANGHPDFVGSTPH